jgi:hypothetical protein
MAIGEHGLEALRKAATHLDVAKTETKIRTFNVSGMLSESYDYVAVTYPTTSSEQYVFKTGGVSGTTVATILVTYTSSAKTDLSSVART